MHVVLNVLRNWKHLQHHAFRIVLIRCTVKYQDILKMYNIPSLHRYLFNKLKLKQIGIVCFLFKKTITFTEEDFFEKCDYSPAKSDSCSWSKQVIVT